MLLHERIKYEKATYCMIPLIWHSRKKQNYRDGTRSVVARGSGESVEKNE